MDALQKMCHGFPWLDMSQVQIAIAKKQVSPMVIQLAYWESEALVIFVAKDRGESWIPNVLNYLRKNGGTFDAAFTAVLQTTPAQEMERLHDSWE